MGDCKGNLETAFKMAAVQHLKVGFDFMLCVGEFVGDGLELAAFARKEKQVPLPTYFIDTSPALLKAAKDGQEICENLTFLGGVGVKEIQGLRIGYLSGKFNGDVYSAEEEEAFVRDCYTKIAVDRLKAEKPVDILLTNEWPRGYERGVKGDVPEPDERDSPALGLIVKNLGPRYHVVGLRDTFCNRHPFVTSHGGMCRMVGMGMVGSKGKEKKWMHALSLKLTPDNKGIEAATECPFSKKRQRDMEPTDTVYIGNLPKVAREDTLHKPLQRCGQIKRLRCVRDTDTGECRGFGFCTFNSIEEATRAVALDGKLQCAGKTLQIRFAEKRQDNQDEYKSKAPRIDLAPHAECWFCLSNPKLEKHLLVSVGRSAYTALAKGGVHENHLLVLPVKHFPCFASMPKDVADDMLRQMNYIKDFYAPKDADLICYERWLPMRNTLANHAQFQAIAIPRRMAFCAQPALLSLGKKAGLIFRKIDSPSELFTLQDGASATPYYYFQLPGDNTARGRMTEHWVCSSDSTKMPLNFGREVLCEILEAKDKLDWRKCVMSEEKETAIAAHLKDKMAAFVAIQQEKEAEEAKK